MPAFCAKVCGFGAVNYVGGSTFDLGRRGNEDLGRMAHTGKQRSQLTQALKILSRFHLQDARPHHLVHQGARSAEARAAETSARDSAYAELRWMVQDILVRRHQYTQQQEQRTACSTPFRPMFPRLTPNGWDISRLRDYRSTVYSRADVLVAGALSTQEIASKETIVLTQSEVRRLDKWVEERSTNSKPLQYLLREQDFGNLSLRVRPPTLIPRPETEFWTHDLAREVIGSKADTITSPFRVLDICSGSGCVGLSLTYDLLQNFKDVKTDLIDVSERAITLGKVNSRRNGLESFTNFHQVDLTKMNKNTWLEDKMYDLIVSNPPYIPHVEMETLSKGVKDWEDHRALDSSVPIQSNKSSFKDSLDPTGLFFYKLILSKVKFDFECKYEDTNLQKSASPPIEPFFVLRSSKDDKKIKPRLAFEVGVNQSDSVQELMFTRGFKRVEKWKDFSNIERCIVGYL